jgi:hypothetical protein
MKSLVEQGYLPIVEAVKKCTGMDPHVQTVRRWVKIGLRGFKLDAKFVNGAYWTTIKSVEEFIDSTNDARLSAKKKRRKS